MDGNLERLLDTMMKSHIMRVVEVHGVNINSDAILRVEKMIIPAVATYSPHLIFAIGKLMNKGERNVKDIFNLALRCFIQKEE